MRIKLPVHAILHRGYIVLKETCERDRDLILKLFAVKATKEQEEGELFIQADLDLPRKCRTFKQNAAVWTLVTAIFESMEGRKPSESEKYNLYLDLLDVYAEKTPNKLNGGLRPIHISESNTLEGSHFIDGLLYHLATVCDLDYNAQITVQSVLQDWTAWRGTLETDPEDYMNGMMLTEVQWRERHVYSEASGRGGVIQRAHIVSRGSDAVDIEASWNWLALTPEEHEEQHRVGWDEFLKIYPHLRGRVERARRLAGKREITGMSKRSVMPLVHQAMEV